MVEQICSDWDPVQQAAGDYDNDNDMRLMIWDQSNLSEFGGMEWNDGGHRVMYWFEIFQLASGHLSLPLNALLGITSNLANEPYQMVGG